MIRHELIERNKTLRQEKKYLFDKLESNKKALGIAGHFAHMSSGQIGDL